MEHTDNIALIILLRLLLNAEPLELVVKDRSIESKNELLNYAKAINSLINRQRECLNISSLNYTITLSIADRNLLNDYLMNYAKNFNKGLYTNVDSLETLGRELINTRNTRKTASNYPVQNIQFMPYILSEYYNNSAFVQSISIAMKDTELTEYPIKIYDYFESGEPSGKFYDNYEDYFDWEICVNLENYINSKTAKTTIKPSRNRKKKEPHFAPLQNKLFMYLEAHVKSTNTLRIEKGLLEADFKNPSAAISKLNNQYQKITHSNDYLIRFDRRNGYYIIQNYWGINLQKVSTPSEIIGY